MTNERQVFHLKKTYRNYRSAAAALTVFALAGFGLSGCAEPSNSAAAAAPSGKIALLLPDLVTARWDQQDKPVFEAAAKESCNSCTVTSYNAKGSASTQLQQAEAALTNGASVVVVAPVDFRSAEQIVDKVHAAGAKVISYASIIQSKNVDYGVTTDIAGIGAQQAQSLVDGLKAKGITSGGLIVMNGSPSDAFGSKYKAGAHSVLDKTNFTVAAEYDTKDWSAENAQNQMSQAITKVGKDGFVGVYAANDQLAGGVIAAMKANGIDPSTRPITGQDGAAAALQRILAGEQYNTINLPIKEFAANTAKIATALAQGQTPPANLINGEVDGPDGVKIPTYLWSNNVITIDQVADMIEPKGFWTLKDICTPDYKDACARAGLL
jgi:D-xylose transport system substrate-binding protein